MPIRVVLVDDVPEVRRLARTALRFRGSFEVVGEAGDGAEAVDVATVLQPDIVVARSADFGEDNLQRTPLLVVEVLSVSTRRIDLGTKRLVFEGAGVPSYWLVDPDEPSLTALELEEGVYREAARVTGEQPYIASTPFPVRIVPTDLVR